MKALPAILVLLLTSVLTWYTLVNKTYTMSWDEVTHYESGLLIHEHIGTTVYDLSYDVFVSETNYDGSVLSGLTFFENTEETSILVSRTWIQARGFIDGRFAVGVRAVIKYEDVDQDGYPVTVEDVSAISWTVEEDACKDRHTFAFIIPPNQCRSDFDLDGDVDGTDLAVFSNEFGRTGCDGWCEGDFDGDGDVDGTDLSVFSGEFGRTDCY